MLSTKPSSVYIETSVISYLTARPARDLVRAAQQQVTHDWWQNERSKFSIVASPLVELECAGGDAGAAADRLAVLKSIPYIVPGPAAEDIVESLLTAKALPIKASRDALHVAICATNGIDFLLTWNCRHLANAVLRSKIEDACKSRGFQAPTITTPELLMEME